MSVQAISWALEQKVDSSRKIVLIVLANRASFENTCFPSVALMAKETGLSPRSIARILNELEELKLISRKRRWRPEGKGQTSCLYSLSMTATVASMGGGMTAKTGGMTATAGRPNTLNRHIEPKEAIKNSGKVKPRIRVKFGSPAFRAWESAPVAIRRQAIPTREGDFWVPSEYPPTSH